MESQTASATEIATDTGHAPNAQAVRVLPTATTRVEQKKKGLDADAFLESHDFSRETWRALKESEVDEFFAEIKVMFAMRGALRALRKDTSLDRVQTGSQRGDENESETADENRPQTESPTACTSCVSGRTRVKELVDGGVPLVCGDFARAKVTPFEFFCQACVQGTHQSTLRSAFIPQNKQVFSGE